MPNKYHSDINGHASAPKPPSERSGGQASYKSESTHAWQADIGPTGRRRNTVGFPEVKQAAKQHMADDYGLPPRERDRYGNPMDGVIMPPIGGGPGPIGPPDVFPIPPTPGLIPSPGSTVPGPMGDIGAGTAVGSLIPPMGYQRPRPGRRRRY